MLYSRPLEAIRRSRQPTRMTRRKTRPLRTRSRTFLRFGV
jgi:hypothetical protein